MTKNKTALKLLFDAASKQIEYGRKKKYFTLIQADFFTVKLAQAIDEKSALSLKMMSDLIKNKVKRGKAEDQLSDIKKNALIIIDFILALFK